MGLPTRQSVVTCVPNRYCLISSGWVRASQTFAVGALIVVIALATKVLFMILKSPLWYRATWRCRSLKSIVFAYFNDAESKVRYARDRIHSFAFWPSWLYSQIPCSFSFCNADLLRTSSVGNLLWQFVGWPRL